MHRQQLQQPLRRRLRIFGGVCYCRIICLDLPLFLILSVYVSIRYVDWLSTNYLLPLNKLQYFDSHERVITYYHRVCTPNDQTTDDTVDLLVDLSNDNDANANSNSSSSSNIDVAVQKMLRHGVTVIPNLISTSTATKLRAYILEENKKEDLLVYVLENTNRWSFLLQVDHDPIISAAIQEVLQPNFIQYLEAVMGPNPAVVELTAITQAYGAEEQAWHQDVSPSGSAVKYGRKFIPTYSLFIPLQNVTAEMGATGICPGTHMCSESNFCAETGFQTSGKQNNWPLGYGAFINQQTTHRGSAHRDPNGPHRVVFILTFAPRPLTFKPFSIETRLIGSGGSYSLHWSQWGHTVNDFLQPLRRMKQPYRTLRSLGIYNHHGGNTNWGWDYITVSSARIVNVDGGGFTLHEFETFLSRGGFKWLPKFLQGNSTSLDNDETSYGWIAFLQETVTKCKLEITKVYLGCLGVYIGCILFFALVDGRKQGRRFKNLAHNVVRLCLIHSVMLSAAWFVRQRVINSTWGRNIQAQRSFRLSNKSLAMAPSLPATLPTDDDIMWFEGLQSESFSSFSRVLEVFHPGNREWNDLVRQFAASYDGLSSPLQEHVRRHMLQITERESRRILIQSDQANWAAAPPEIRHMFCHKTLLQMSNGLIGRVLQILDHIFSEARYGYWRDTSLYRKHISVIVYALRNKIMRMQLPVRQQSTIKDTAMLVNKLFVIRRHGKMESNPFIAFGGSRMRISRFPVHFSNPELFPATWLNAGDVAEASYDDDRKEWYRGVILNASASLGVWDVLFDDGDRASNVCHTCVRPFLRYNVNETIDVMMGPDYVPCHVVAIHHFSDDVVYDVRLDDDSNSVIEKVATKRLRRNYRNEKNDDNMSDIPARTRVMAWYQDEGGDDSDYYPGKIIQYHSKMKSYDVQFDDGDVANHIQRRDIELINPVRFFVGSGRSSTCYGL